MPGCVLLLSYLVQKPRELDGPDGRLLQVHCQAPETPLLGGV